MPWKKGKVKLDDGTTYPAELLVRSDGQVWNVKVYKENDIVEELNVQTFANKLGKDIESVYPYTYELED